MTSLSRRKRQRPRLLRQGVKLTNRGMEDTREPGTVIYAVNMIPDKTGLRVRRGAELRATLNDEVTAFLSHSDGSIWAADDTGCLYDVTSPASTTVPPSPTIYGQDPAWFSTEFTTSAGQFVIATTDGDDVVWNYNGTTWEPMPIAANCRYIPADLSSITNWPASWTPGVTVTGGTSGATGTLVGLSDTASASGVWVTGVTGAYVNAEALTTSAAPAGAGVTTTGADAAAPNGWQITGISNFTDVTRPFVHGGRLWFVEPDALAAWYLPASQFAGAATRFPLAGVFKRGGELLAGGEVSSDSGSGMQSRCVFISTLGEIAIYEGLNPATWSLVGVYEMTPPMGPRTVVPVGGDLTVIGQHGMTSVLTTVFAPKGTDEATQIMDPVRGYWEWFTQTYGSDNWHAAWWAAKGYYLIAPPPQISADSDVMVLSSNQNWSMFNGWPISALHVHNSGMVFGTPNGRVANAEETGQDMGAEYRSWTATVASAPVAMKMQLRRGRAISLATTDPMAYVWSQEGLDMEEDPDGGTATSGVGDTAVWGATSAWGMGTLVWGTGGFPHWETYYDWQGLNSRGHECVVGVSVLNNSAAPPKVTVQALEWIAEIGNEPW